MRKMIQKSLSIIILCITIVTFRTAPSHAQSEWEKTYGGAENDAGYHIEKTHDGNYVIVGYTESFGAGGKDVWLLKINDSGDTLWTRTYGGTADDVGNKVRLAPDNGFIIAGYTESFGAGMKDVYLIKTDEYGDTLWTRTYCDSLDDVGNSVVVDDLGNSYLVGYLTRLPEDNWPIHK
ncbi:MAG: hypothetical protein GY850_46205, partial [bacterium]|nr:hypothetical protein [bacterium]